MKTYLPKKPTSSQRVWFVLDAKNRPVGRLAVRVANLLRGKTKVTFTPAVDTGDFVIVINADKVKLTGKKEDDKIYPFFSGYRSGLKEYTAKELRERHPTWLVELAVKRMLPRNRTSRRMMRRLKIYAGDKHPHGVQKPVAVEMK